MTSQLIRRPDPTPTQFDTLALDKGLVFGTSPIEAPAGSLSDCLNYEVGGGIGISRISGFTRFDGVHNSSTDTWFSVRVNESPENVDIRFPPGMLVRLKGEETFSSVVVSSAGSTLVLTAVKDGEVLYKKGETIENETLQSAFILDIEESSSLKQTAKSIVSSLNDINERLRGFVTPFESAPVGVALFKNTTYAFVEEFVIPFENGEFEVFVGDKVTVEGEVYTILDVVLTGGSWALNDATGTFTVAGNIGVQQGKEILLVPGGLNPLDIIRVGDIRNPTLLDTPSGSGIWQAVRAVDSAPFSETGWRRTLNNTFSVGFKNGLSSTNELPRLDRRDTSNLPQTGIISTGVIGDQGTAVFARPNIVLPTDIQPSPGVVQPFKVMTVPGNIVSNSPSDVLSALSVAGDATVLGDVVNNALILDPSLPRSGSTSTISNRLLLSSFKLSPEIPEDAQILGVEVLFNNLISPAESPSANHGHMEFSIKAELYKREPTEGVISIISDPRTLFVTNKFGARTPSGNFVIGGSEDLWGASSLQASDINDSEFGISLSYLANINIPDTAPSQDLGDLVRVILDQIQLRVTFRTLRNRVFFQNGSDVIAADLISFRVFSGRLQNGTARGILQISNLDGAQAGRQTFREGADIFSSETLDPGSKIGEVILSTSGPYISGNMLPTTKDMQTAGTRFETITANFFGDEAFAGLYGVSGAGRAFTWDGNFLLKVFAIEDEDKDKPRHIAFHHSHLALGYISGQVLFSQPGEPEVFDGARGSFEIGVGDSITGLAPIQGSSLAVFGKDSITAITGTVQENISTQTISPKSGAIEYTVVDVGGDPIYTDLQGISSLQQSATFGTFSGRRLSGSVASWLRPRLRIKAISPGVPAASGILGALAFRSKNMYSLLFRDGYVLSMNVFSQEPKFSLQRYFLGQDISTEQTDRFFEPFAWSAGVDATGADRIHMIHKSTTSETPKELENFIYEFNTGWSFDGNYIPHFVELNAYFGPSFTTYKTLRGMIIEGMSRGFANVGMKISSLVPVEFGKTVLDISLPDKPFDRGLLKDITRFDSVTQGTFRGRSFCIRMEGTPEGSSELVRLKNPEPEYSIQVLIPRFDPAGAQEI